MIIYTIAILLTFIILLSGCNKIENIDKVDDNNKKEIVVYSYYETKAQQKGLDHLINDFNAYSKEYTCHWEYIPMTEFSIRLAIGYTQNMLPDVVVIDNPDMKEYIGVNMFMDITEHVEKWDIEKYYYPKVWKTNVYKGKCYGVPFSCNNLALIYNKDLFEEKNLSPPKTWEEFEYVAKKLTDTNIYGFALSAIEGEQSSFQIAPWLLNKGVDLNSIGDENSLKTFKFIKKLVDSGYIDRNCINLSQVDIIRKFIKKEVAMIENGPWALPALIESDINFDIIQLPCENMSKTVLGGENLAIIKNKNIEGALKFIKYYCKKDVMKNICEISYAIPPRIEAAEDIYETNKYYRVFITQMNNTISRTEIEKWTEISEQLSASMFDIISGKESAETVNDIFIDK